MADDPVKAASSVGKGGKSFLTTKVGPLPMWIWLAAGVAIYVYFQRSQAKTAATAAPNQQTDPAGNIGSIDPATGYVYGTPEDTAALAANNAGTGSTGDAGQQATSGGQKYADNNTWGIAAVNYLVGLGIDATTANQAIQNYLTSQPLTTAQQGDVNLAIQALGPPPSLPGPIATNPNPITTPGGPPGPTGTVTVPRVTGLTATAAVAKLTSVGLKAGSEGARGGSAIVNSQTPGAGAKVASGSTVDLGVVQAGHNGGNPPHVGKTAPAPTGLVVASKSSHSMAVKWNRSTGATGYHVLCTDAASKKVVSDHDLSSATTTATFSGLSPSHTYVVDVWAQPPATTSGPHAEVSATLPRTG